MLCFNRKELKENLPQLKSLDNELLYDSCEDTDSEDENEQNGTEQGLKYEVYNNIS